MILVVKPIIPGRKNWKKEYLKTGLSTGPTTNLVISMIDETIEQYGKPKVIKSDNGPQFRKTFKKELEKRNIYHLNSPAFPPHLTRKLKEANRDLKQVISNIKNLDNINIAEGIKQAIRDHNHLRPHHISSRIQCVNLEYYFYG